MGLPYHESTRRARRSAGRAARETAQGESRKHCSKGGPRSIVCNVRKGATKRDAVRVFGGKVSRVVLRKFKCKKKKGQPRLILHKAFTYFDTAADLEAAWIKATGELYDSENPAKRAMHSIERQNRKSVKVQMEYAEEVGGDFRNHITRV
eukprot:gene9767-3322_t